MFRKLRNGLLTIAVAMAACIAPVQTIAAKPIVSNIPLKTDSVIKKFDWKNSPIANVSANDLTPRTITVCFRNQVNESALLANGAQIKRAYRNFPFATVQMTGRGISKLRESAEIDCMDENHAVKMSTIDQQTVKQSIQMAQQYPDWGINKIKAPIAWQEGNTGTGVKVAVMDTGIFPHEDLQIAGGISLMGYTTSYIDDNGHGTHVAGIIGAKNNTIGVVGVAPDVSLYSIKVLDGSGNGTFSEVLGGLDWAITNKMDILNLSLSGPTASYSIQLAFDDARAKGLTIVAAAGNNGSADGTGDTIYYPAKYDSVIAVGATTMNNERAYFSATGPALDIAAPGYNILSTYINNQYVYLNGTSMATPFVAGVAALIKKANPTYTPEQILGVMTKNAVDLGVTGKDSLFGNGLIQAITSDKMMNYAFSNAGFESGNISGWYEWHPWNQPAALGVDRFDVKSGGYKLYFWRDTAYQQSIHQILKGIVNGTYEISGWVKLSAFGGTPKTARMELMDYGGPNMYLSLTPNGLWTEVKMEVKVTNNQLDLGYFIDSPGKTSFQLDDVSIKMLSVSTPTPTPTPVVTPTPTPVVTPTPTPVVTPTPTPVVTPTPTPVVTPTPTPVVTPTPTPVVTPTPTPTIVPSPTPTQGPTGANLFINTGFESGNYFGWYEWHPSNQPLALGVDRNDVYSGSFKAYFWRDAAYKQSIHQVRTGLENGTYELSGWVKASAWGGAPRVIRMEALDYGGAPIYQAIAINGKWTQYTIRVNVTNGQVDLGFYVDSPGKTSLQIDEVSLRIVK